MAGGGARLGIDFGTSNTVAVLHPPNGRPRNLLFDGSPILPSAVYLDRAGAVLTGRDALYSARLDPARFESNPKRRLDEGTVLLGDQELRAIDLVAAVLSRVAGEASRTLGHVPRDVTVTYPAAWGSSRRALLSEAAKQAGLGHVGLVVEPVGAAAYFVQVLDHAVPTGSGVVVYDFGAGTFDASVVQRTETGFEVVAVDGRNDIGGLDLDHALLTHVGKMYSDRAPELWSRLINPQTTEDRRHRRVLVEDVRSAKERLSRYNTADIVLPLYETDATVTRNELEDVVRPMLDQTVRVTQSVLRASKLPADRITGVFLVGGSSRIPMVATLLHRALGFAPTALEQPELVVAEGALVNSSTRAVPSAEGTSLKNPLPPVGAAPDIAARPVSPTPRPTSPPAGPTSPPVAPASPAAAYSVPPEDGRFGPSGKPPKIVGVWSPPRPGVGGEEPPKRPVIVSLPSGSEPAARPVSGPVSSPTSGPPRAAGSARPPGTQPGRAVVPGSRPPGGPAAPRDARGVQAYGSVSGQGGVPARGGAPLPTRGGVAHGPGARPAATRLWDGPLASDPRGPSGRRVFGAHALLWPVLVAAVVIGNFIAQAIVDRLIPRVLAGNDIGWLALTPRWVGLTFPLVAGAAAAALVLRPGRKRLLLLGGGLLALLVVDIAIYQPGILFDGLGKADTKVPDLVQALLFGGFFGVGWLAIRGRSGWRLLVGLAAGVLPAIEVVTFSTSRLQGYAERPVYYWFCVLYLVSIVAVAWLAAALPGSRNVRR